MDKMRSMEENHILAATQLANNFQWLTKSYRLLGGVLPAGDVLYPDGLRLAKCVFLVVRK